MFVSASLFAVLVVKEDISRAALLPFAILDVSSRVCRRAGALEIKPVPIVSKSIRDVRLWGEEDTLGRDPARLAMVASTV